MGMLNWITGKLGLCMMKASTHTFYDKMVL